jgi:hypothetical protein
MRHPVFHPKVPVIVAPVIIAVSVGFAVQGQPIALLWGFAVATIWLAPEILARWNQRPPSAAVFYLASLVAGLVMALAWPIARENPNATYPKLGNGATFRNDLEVRVVWAFVSCSGLVVIATVLVSIVIQVRWKRRQSTETHRKHGD